MAPKTSDAASSDDRRDASAAARRLVAGGEYLVPAAYLEHAGRHPPIVAAPAAVPDDVLAMALKMADAPEATRAAGDEGGAVFDAQGPSASILHEPRGAVFQAMKDFAGALNEKYWRFPEPLTYPTFRVNTYRQGGEFDWHQDLYGPDSETTARAVTAVLLLDPAGSYEGGEFDVEGWGRDIETLRPDQGRMFAFPACYLHRVRKITKGRRRALVLSVAAAIDRRGLDFARIKTETRSPSLRTAREREMADLFLRRRDLMPRA